MEVIKVEGIVIGETNYSESSKILRVFTKDYGIISIMSKGCRNIKSKLRGVSSKLSYANFMIRYKKDGISTLIDADTIDTLRNIITDITRISYLSYLLDLSDQVYRHSKSDKIYPILISIINKLNDKYDPEVLSLIYELKLLEFLGISPNIDSCCICGSTKNILTISVKEGGFVCQDCYSGGKIYNRQVIRLIRMFIYLDIDNVTKINLKDETKKELSLFIEDYYDTFSGIYLKSKDFLKYMQKIES